MNPVKWLLAAEPVSGKHCGAIRWWELRRIPFNFVVGCVGVAAIVVMELIGSTIVQPGEDFEEPLALLMGILLFGFAVNASYTFGWILEIRICDGDPNKRRAYRLRNFRRWLAWSCAVASLPAWFSVLAWLEHKFGA
jgi:hypothetical protein